MRPFGLFLTCLYLFNVYLSAVAPVRKLDIYLNLFVGLTTLTALFQFRQLEAQRQLNSDDDQDSTDIYR